MKIPIFGGASSGFLSDASVRIHFAKGYEFLKSVFPGLTQEADGSVVYVQKLSSAGSSPVAGAVSGFVQSVEVESDRLTWVLAGVVGFVLVLVGLIFYVKK